MDTTIAAKEYRPDYYERVIKHTDLTEATVDTAQVFDLVFQHAGRAMLVKDTHIEVLEPFDSADAANNSLLADVGDDDPDKLLDAGELHATTAKAIVGTAASQNALITHADGVKLTLTPAAGKALTGFTSGKMIVRVLALFLG